MALAIVFPGQGSPQVGMFRDLFEGNELAHDWAQRANTKLGYRLTDIMFEGPLETLVQTAHYQPALYLVECVLYRLLGITPDMAAGHSAGQYAALFAAEVFGQDELGFEEGLRLISVRARGMQRAGERNPGTMGVILGLGGGAIEDICREVSQKPGHGVEIGNINCDGQFVITGTVAGVEAALEIARTYPRVRTPEIRVSAAFHSSRLMKPALPALKAALVKSELARPKFPVYDNISANPFRPDSDLKGALVNHVVRPVNWWFSVRHMLLEGGATEFVELGPGQVLAGLIKRICSDREVMITSINTLDQLNAYRTTKGLDPIS